MDSHPSSGAATENAADVDRVGDEIAELSAHLDAALVSSISSVISTPARAGTAAFALAPRG
jgi:hypothetical protein